MIVINRFQRNCGIFRRGGKNPLLSTTLGQFTQTKREKKKPQTKPNQTKSYKTNKNERHCTTTVHIATRCNVASEATQRGKLGTDPEASRGKL
jgi:hypothetical protein